MSHAGVDRHVLVLILPRVFELDFCEALIAIYRYQGSAESDFMREVDGKKVRGTDPRSICGWSCARRFSTRPPASSVFRWPLHLAHACIGN